MDIIIIIIIIIFILQNYQITFFILRSNIFR